VLVFPEEAQRQAAARRVYARAATVQDVSGRTLTWETAAQAFITAFCQTLELQLLPGELTPTEKVRAGELLETKYNHPSWTERI
jgi:lipoate-protein ligase A